MIIVEIETSNILPVIRVR